MAIKKISEFVAGIPTSKDKILFEQNEKGKSATISDVGRAMGINKLAQTNLLKPALSTQTYYGITCTNNGDGTFTINGTATGNSVFILAYVGRMSGCKLVGCPTNNSGSYLAILRDGAWENVIQDRGDGAEISLDTESNHVVIAIGKGLTVDNVVFKPMITTDLSATYDDFVSWEESSVKNKQLSTVIPTKTSQLTNDSGFITGSYLPVSGGVVTGDTAFTGSTTVRYLKIEAFPGFGSGATNIWYNGNNGGITMENATDIVLGNKYVWKQGDRITGAVFNDLADAIPVGEGDGLEAGYCYGFDGEHYTKTSEYLQKSYIGIHSDTYGFKLGHEEDKEKLNVAGAGVVLAYGDKEYEVGTPLTCTSDGHLTEIKLEDKIKYPERVAATYWKNEPNEEWGPEGDKIKVNGRKWVKVK